MRRRSSTEIGRFPCLDFYRQNRRQPAGCQRIIVSGCATTRASRQPACRERNARDRRAEVSTSLGLTPRSFNKVSSRRRNRFSASIDRRRVAESVIGPARSNNSRTMFSRRAITLVIKLNGSRTRQACEAVWIVLLRSPVAFVGLTRQKPASNRENCSVLYSAEPFLVSAKWNRKKRPARRATTSRPASSYCRWRLPCCCGPGPSIGARRLRWSSFC